MPFGSCQHGVGGSGSASFGSDGYDASENTVVISCEATGQDDDGVRLMIFLSRICIPTIITEDESYTEFDGEGTAHQRGELCNKRCGEIRFIRRPDTGKELCLIRLQI